MNLAVDPCVGRGHLIAVAKTMALFGLIASMLAVALDALGFNLMGFGALDVPRNAVSFWVFGLCLAVFAPRFEAQRTSLVLIIPLLTQFYQTGLAWDYPVGPSSLIRILPYLAVGTVMFARLLRHPVSVSKWEQLGWIASATFGILGFIGGFQNGGTGWFGLFVFAVFLPLVYGFLKGELGRDSSSVAAIGAAGLLGFLMFAVGSFVVIRLGSAMDIGGVSGLLGTRNVSDYNLIFAYMLLLWPVALVACAWLGPGWVGAISTLFLASAVLGLSRTGIVMVPLLVIAGLLTLYARQGRSLMKSFAAMAAVGLVAWSAAPNRESLGLVWAQRFNVGSVEQALDVANRIKPGGDDSLARDQLRNEALRLWRQDPLIGHGFGGFGEFSVRGYNDAHSVSFTTLAESGVLGLASVYALLGFIALRLVRLNRVGDSGPKIVFFLSLLVWLVAVHTVGGNLGVFSQRGFNVNAINGMLLVVYLWVHRLFVAAPRRELTPA